LGGHFQGDSRRLNFRENSALHSGGFSDTGTKMNANKTKTKREKILLAMAACDARGQEYPAKLKRAIFALASGGSL
jgi:hypothetical protein